MNLSLEVLPEDADSSEDRFQAKDVQDLLQMWKLYYPKIGFQLPWVAYLVVCDGQIVGTGAFNGAPSHSRVEISYWTFAEFEGKGIATEVCRQLTLMAKQAAPDVQVFAKTAPEENASVRLLKKNHFVFNGIVLDEEIGDAWEWIFPY